MDPVSAGIGIIGLGIKLFSGFSAMGSAQQAYNIQSNISGLENQVNDQREQQMQLSARRQDLEIYRKTQQLKAQSLSGATAGNAQFSSGAKGGQDEVTSEGAFNAFGVNSNLAIGENIFSLNKQISGQKLALSGVQTSMATDQGIGAIGTSLMGGAGTIGNIFKGMGGQSSGENGNTPKSFDNLGSGFDI